MNWEQLAKPKPIFPGTPIASRILESPLWVAQLKVDGVRALTVVGRSSVKMTSKHGIAVPISSDAACSVMAGVPAMSILDAEWLQSCQQLWVFDIFQIAGADVSGQPLSERLLRLNANVEANDAIRVVPTMRERKGDYYNAVIEAGGEGVVLKKLSDPYPRGGVIWLKLKPIRS